MEENANTGGRRTSLVEIVETIAESYSEDFQDHARVDSYGHGRHLVRVDYHIDMWPGDPEFVTMRRTNKPKIMFRRNTLAPYAVIDLNYTNEDIALCLDFILDQITEVTRMGFKPNFYVHYTETEGFAESVEEGIRQCSTLETFLERVEKANSMREVNRTWGGKKGLVVHLDSLLIECVRVAETYGEVHQQIQFDIAAELMTSIQPQPVKEERGAACVAG